MRRVEAALTSSVRVYVVVTGRRLYVRLSRAALTVARLRERRSSLKKYLFAGAIAFGALTSPIQAATFNVGSPNFVVTTGTPTTPNISAFFYNAFGASTTFDDTFLFTIPQNGLGSGSIVSSFSNPMSQVVIEQLFINGTLYPVGATDSGYSRTANGIKIVAGVQNSIRVVGKVIGSGNYVGNATFSAAPVPEPASWALMIGGFGLVGAAIRRSAKASRVTFA